MRASRKIGVQEPSATLGQKRIKRDPGRTMRSPHYPFEAHRHLPRIDPCKARLDESAAARNAASMIGSVRHKALRNYWTKGKTKGLNAEWIPKLRRILATLEAADEPEEMKYPGSRFHLLKGDRTGDYSVSLTANFRVTFGWNEDGAADIDIEGYHR